MSQLLENTLDQDNFLENYFDSLKVKGKIPSEFIEPIDTMLLSGFKEWVAWLPFGRLCPGNEGPHPGYDFAAYLTNENVCRFSLPDNLPVRAIADGNVMFVFEQGLRSSVCINHAINKGFKKRNENILIGNYGHIGSCVNEGDYVKKGQIIGHLINETDDSNLFSYLSHLHFDIEIKVGRKFIPLNPLKLFPYLENNGVNFCGNPYFTLNNSDVEVIPSKKRIWANTIKATYLRHKPYVDLSEHYAQTHLGEWGKLF